MSNYPAPIEPADYSDYPDVNSMGDFALGEELRQLSYHELTAAQQCRWRAVYRALLGRIADAADRASDIARHAAAVDSVDDARAHVQDGPDQGMAKAGA